MIQHEQVNRVIDGDTFETANREEPIRLERVNAPEIGQQGSVEAKHALQQLILGKTVSVEVKAYDSYGRAIAETWIDGMSVNDAMIKIVSRM